MRLFDTVWGFISFNALSQRFINTYEFKRMINIKQLGTCCFIFPGASGNRFEHSVGVGYLARTHALHLQKVHPELNITDRFVDLVQLAGLTHDIGHGPFSHVFDKLLNTKHEDRSREIFKHMVRKYDIHMSQDEIQFVCDTYNPTEQQKSDWRYQIVSSSVDVDRIDYLLRDANKVGTYINFTDKKAFSMLHNSYIINNSIVFSNKQEINDFIDARYYMYRNIYKHPLSLEIDKLVLEVFDKSDSIFNIKSDKLDTFLQLDDAILTKIYSDKKTTDDIKLKIDDIFKFYMSLN